MISIAKLVCLMMLMTTGATLLAEPASAAACHGDGSTTTCHTNAVVVCENGFCVMVLRAQDITVGGP